MAKTRPHRVPAWLAWPLNIDIAVRCVECGQHGRTKLTSYSPDDPPVHPDCGGRLVRITSAKV